MDNHEDRSKVDPIKHIDNTNYNHYALQLNVYKLLLEKNYKKEISKMYFVVFHPVLQTYDRYEVPDFTTEVLFLLRLRVNDLYGDKYEDKMNEWVTNLLNLKPKDRFEKLKEGFGKKRTP